MYPRAGHIPAYSAAGAPRPKALVRSTRVTASISIRSSARPWRRGRTPAENSPPHLPYGYGRWRALPSSVAGVEPALHTLRGATTRARLVFTLNKFFRRKDQGIGGDCCTVLVLLRWRTARLVPAQKRALPVNEVLPGDPGVAGDRRRVLPLSRGRQSGGRTPHIHFQESLHRAREKKKAQRKVEQCRPLAGRRRRR